MTTPHATAARWPLMERLAAFARFSEEEGALTRRFLTPAHRAAADQLMSWMREAGMRVRLDAAGTVVGRYEGARPGAPTVLIGSHIDTVRNAGRYDGNLGVLAAVAAVDALNRAGERLSFAVEVLGFGDEEGVRFPATLTGSRAVAGTLDPAALEALDRDGVRMADALAAFGGDPARLGAAARRPEDVLAFLEVHIEQGPVLEEEGLPLGVVTGIAGATRLSVTVEGAAGHAGTVPMAMRRDALAAAAEMILAVEVRAGAEAGLVGTVGMVEAFPGAANVIPGRARFTVDLRSGDDLRRAAALVDLEARLDAIARRRGVTVSVEETHDAPAVVCGPALMALLEEAVEAAGVRPFHLPSGAGHDAMALAALCPVAMLFVRCKGGISHNPAESITEADADLAVRVLIDALRRFARTVRL